MSLDLHARIYKRYKQVKLRQAVLLKRLAALEATTPTYVQPMVTAIKQLIEVPVVVSYKPTPQYKIPGINEC